SAEHPRCLAPRQPGYWRSPAFGPRSPSHIASPLKLSPRPMALRSPPTSGRCRIGWIAAPLALFPTLVAAQTPAASDSTPLVALPPVEVVAPSPLAGVGIDRDKVPGTARSLSADDFARTASPYVTETLFQRIPDVSLSDPNGNSAVQELSYRGFAASPLQGTPQGIAVYMSGIRLNEAFGDTVNWDLIPTNAISRGDVWTNNPCVDRLKSATHFTNCVNIPTNYRIDLLEKAIVMSQNALQHVPRNFNRLQPMSEASCDMNAT